MCWEKGSPGKLKPGLILDVGCGTGEQSLFLAKRDTSTGCRYIQGNADKSERKCKRRKSKDNLSLVIASAEALPFRDKSFDGLISIFGVFNHIPGQSMPSGKRTGSWKAAAVLSLLWWTGGTLRVDQCAFKFKVSWLISSLRRKEYTVNGLWTYYFRRRISKKCWKLWGTSKDRMYVAFYLSIYCKEFIILRKSFIILKMLPDEKPIQWFRLLSPCQVRKMIHKRIDT